MAGHIRPHYRPYINNRLESFFDQKEPDMTFKRYLFDSGGYVARRRNIKISVKEYADCLNRFKVPVGFNLDTNDVEESLRNQAFLEGACKHTYIIPVYHGSDYYSEYRDLIDDFVKRYQFIAVGGIAGGFFAHAIQDEFFKHVFRRTRDQVKVHALGVTREQTLKTFPFFCCDSTSWQGPGRYGNGRAVKTSRKLSFYNKKLHYTMKIIEEMKWFNKLESDITSLWERRGVVWKDDVWGIHEIKN